MENMETKYAEMFGDKNGLGWGSKDSQYCRFEILRSCGIQTGKESILDVGCGHGDLIEYLMWKFPKGITYTGIDVRGCCIETARKKYKGFKFIKTTVYELEHKYDYVLASGIFCFDSWDWKEDVERTLKRMFEICHSAVACNFLSDLSKGKRRDGMKYCKIEEIISIIKPISDRFVIRHDYKNNDMTVYLYK